MLMGIRNGPMYCLCWQGACDVLTSFFIYICTMTLCELDDMAIGACMEMVGWADIIVLGRVEPGYMRKKNNNKKKKQKKI